jgi:MFS family permease
MTPERRHWPAALGPDGRLLFITRFVRLFAYGALSVVLVLYLAGSGLSAPAIGALLTLTLVGDTFVSLVLTTRADRLGRRRTLIVGALLMAAAGLTFASTTQLWLLAVAGTLGVISPSGHEVGPFLSIEQAALSQLGPDRARTEVLAWYALTGAIATALGALAGGAIAGRWHGASPIAGDRAVVIVYAVLGVALAVLFAFLSRSAEPAASSRRDGRAGFAMLSGLHQSRDIVLKLSALFALDSFGGGFIVQSFVAYWFALRFGLGAETIGAVFFWANLLAGVSALVAARIARRFGLVRTMVMTHLPSNVLLFLVPLMPTAPLAIAVLLARFSISQMDVPARQSYVMAVVRPDERSAAAGVTGVARTIGAAVSPLFVGMMFAEPAWRHLPFFVAGAVKIVYDLSLYFAFVTLRPPEEQQPKDSSRPS